MSSRGSVVVLALVAATPVALAGTPEGPLLFASSDRCLACHNGLLTPEGEDVSLGRAWQPSMMANSARDPYWHAAVRRETLDHPRASSAIQHECSKCHMPMARYRANLEGREQPVLDRVPGSTPAAGHRDRLAADGTSCSLCHQILADGLGEEASFVGGFRLDETRPWGTRRIFGPHEVPSGLIRVMRSASELEPARATHVGSSELCATCHTLITHALGPEGETVGELPEQVPYLEWRHSDFAGSADCVTCHMPPVQEPTPIVSVLGDPRDGLSRHIFRGGNFVLPRILGRHAGELGVKASPSLLGETSRRTLHHLATESSTLTVERADLVGSTLKVDIAVTNGAGHKLPTAYPSRRAWLHVTVIDSRGQAVFESGALQKNGAVRGNDNDEDSSRYEPHHETIDGPDQVQIYEAILAGPDGTVTTGLLTAVRFLKDNRILPRGFDKASAEERIAVHGAAAADADFADGSDRIRYEVEVAGAEGPFEVRAELLYQPIGYRWAQNLRGRGAPETDRFVGYFEEIADRSAAVLARNNLRGGGPMIRR